MLIVQFDHSSELQENLSLAVPTIINESVYDSKKNLQKQWVVADFKNFEGIIQLLDSGIDTVVIQFKALESISTAEIAAALENVPSNRLALHFTPDLQRPSNGPNFKALAPIFDYFIISNPPSVETIVQLQLNFTNNIFLIESKDQGPKELLEKGFNVVLNSENVQIGDEEKSKIDFVDLYLTKTTTDRTDGLYSTMVVDEHGIALGLCYSSKESISKALETKTGVYMSRTRGLWFKGKTSGATQTLLGIDFDCDTDTIRFKVAQTCPGFCHLNTRTCFGPDNGITALYHTLKSRFKDAPPKSYTKRLFNDPGLLHSKIMEEAEELCTATSKDEIAWEAADLLYFALTKCVASGVSLSDVERHLDLKSKKITRRPGNAKPPKPSSAPTSVDIPENEWFRMKVHEAGSLQKNEFEKLLLRPILNTSEILERVKPIVKQVREQGDKAIKELTAKFDKVDLDSVVLKAPFPKELMQVEPKVKEAIDLAYSNIEKFHEAQLEKKPLVVETMPGVTCSRFFRPIERVGLYVPGGTAVLPSSTLMLGIPAKVAGCKQIVIATPPTKDGSIVPEVVYVAHKVGASLIVKAGGAQAVAAMAYGTETVPKVDKICGPGNQYVTQAKMLAQSDSSALLSIDMPAGPSELLVIADKTADPRYVISDLLSQAEHGVDSQVVLLTVGLGKEAIENYQKELYKQASILPRTDIVKVSISKSYIISFETIEQAIEFSNQYAPEHLILNINNPSSLLNKVMNAGSVFVGPYSPESCGDYASGTNHTLPTYGYARMYSGVNTHTFVKHITSQTLTKEGLDSIGDAVTTLASIEGLEAHRNAVAIRLEDIRK